MAREIKKRKPFFTEKELSFEFFRSPGPGGQGVNKISSGVRLRWDLEKNTKLKEEEKEKIRKKYKNKITGSGDFILEAKKFRSQLANKEFALGNFQKLIYKALEEKERKTKFRFSAKSKERRLKEKKKISEKKKLRKITKEELF